jgi:hypothetical protein
MADSCVAGACKAEDGGLLEKAASWECGMGGEVCGYVAMLKLKPRVVGWLHRDGCWLALLGC